MSNLEKLPVPISVLWHNLQLIAWLFPSFSIFSSEFFFFFLSDDFFSHSHFILPVFVIWNSSFSSFQMTFLLILTSFSLFSSSETLPSLPFRWLFLSNHLHFPCFSHPISSFPQHSDDFPTQIIFIFHVSVIPFPLFSIFRWLFHRNIRISSILSHLYTGTGRISFSKFTV